MPQRALLWSRLDAEETSSGDVPEVRQQVCEVVELPDTFQALKVLWSANGFQTGESGFDSRQRLQ